MHAPRRSRLLFALMLAPLLTAAKCRKDKDKEIDDQDITPASPTVTLRVTGVEPDRVRAGELTRAVVYGAGFESGVQVRVDESPVSSVTFQDSGVLKVTLPPMSAGSHDLRVRNPDGKTATLRNAIVAEAGQAVDPTAGLNCRAITIRFALDSDHISPESLSELGSKKACFTERGGEIKVAGHCDERGTTDYNLALGQRRADAVKRWIVSQGVLPSRVRTLSFGEENPAVAGSNEAAWAANRRAEIAAMP